MDGEAETRLCRNALKQDGAGATHTVLGADVRSGQTQLVTNEVAQKQAGLDVALITRAVHSHRDTLLGHLPSSRSNILPSGEPIAQSCRSITSVAGGAGPPATSTTCSFDGFVEHAFGQRLDQVTAIVRVGVEIGRRLDCLHGRTRRR